MLTDADFELMDRSKAQDTAQFCAGYTGHVPRLRATFGTRIIVAAKNLKPDAEDLATPVFSGVASPARSVSPPSRPMTQASRMSQMSTRSLRLSTADGPRVEAVCGGQRRLVQNPQLKYRGTGFCGTLMPDRRTDRFSGLQAYEQGSRVNLTSYYDASRASGWKVNPIQSGFAGKNESHGIPGDSYYFSGKQMYETTQLEAYKADIKGASNKPKLTAEEEYQEAQERLRTYAVARAVVGKRRVQEIISQIKEGLEVRVTGGNGFRRRMFALFDKDGTGAVDPPDFQVVCRDLGIKISELEAVAVYGDADTNGDGAMSFNEFLARYLGEGIARVSGGRRADETIAGDPESPSASASQADMISISH